MSELFAHRRALLCQEETAIQDYQQAMHSAVNAVSDWLQQDKMYTGGSIKHLRAQIAFHLGQQPNCGSPNKCHEPIDGLLGSKPRRLAHGRTTH